MSYNNGAINSYINFCMNTSEKAELIASIDHKGKSSKSGISIYNSEVPNKDSRKGTK